MTTTTPAPGEADLVDEVVDLQRSRAASEARSAELMLAFVDARRDAGRACVGGESAAELEARFAADELGLATTTPTGTVQRLLARTRRVQSRLPGAWELWRAGEIDGYKVRLIDEAAQRLVHGDSLVTLDEQVCPLAPSKTPGQLQTWLHRFVARTEPEEFQRRYRRAFGDRTVYTRPGEDGMGWLNACHTQVDIDQVEARLEAMARALGADDPRTMDQRKADLLVGLLLGTIPNHVTGDGDPQDTSDAHRAEEANVGGTGAGMGLVRRSDPTPPRTTSSSPSPSPSQSGTRTPSRSPFPAPTVIGVVVPIQTLVGDADVPGETLDRRSVVPAEVARQRAVQPGTLFYKLLTDRGGNLLEVSEAGRFASDRLGFAVAARDATSCFPTSSVPAARCDLDHTIEHPEGPTGASNLGPLDRRAHNAKTAGRLRLRQPEPGTFEWRTSTGHSYTTRAEPLPTAEWLANQDLPFYRPEDYLHPDDINPSDPMLDDLPTRTSGVDPDRAETWRAIAC